MISADLLIANSPKNGRLQQNMDLALTAFHLSISDYSTQQLSALERDNRQKSGGGGDTDGGGGLGVKSATSSSSSSSSQQQQSVSSPSNSDLSREDDGRSSPVLLPAFVNSFDSAKLPNQPRNYRTFDLFPYHGLRPRLTPIGAERNVPFRVQ